MKTQENPRMRQARTSARDFAKGDLLAVSSVTILKAALDGATFTEFEGVRMTWVGEYSTVRKVNEESAKVAWHRIVKAGEIVKPKSDAPGSAEKQAKREKARQAALALQNLTPAQVQKETAKLAALAAKGDMDAAKKIHTINKAQEDKAKMAGKGAEDSRKAKAKAIAARVMLASMEQLAKIEAMLDTVKVPTVPVKVEEKEQKVA